MAIVFDEIEATVLPEAAPKQAGAEPGQSSGPAPGDAYALQSELVRMRERAERLRAD
jgi:hypothetical protein